MPHNMNTTDRLVRAGLGAALLAIGLWWGIAAVAGIVALALAALMLVTAAVGFCPLYTLLGISTRPAPHRTRRATAGSARRG